jgi:hypothetical protein
MIKVIVKIQSDKYLGMEGLHTKPVISLKNRSPATTCPSRDFIYWK